MKRVLLLLLFITARALAQERFEAGVFADYVHLHQRIVEDTHHAGLGGRFSVHVYPHVSVGGEMAYDFAQQFTDSFGPPPCTSSPCPLFPVILVPTDISFLHGSFGPEFHVGSHNIRLFGTVKGGFVNFHLHRKLAGFSSIRNTNAVLYSGGGVEFFKSRFGLRIDVGDEIYFKQGANHNLRASLGPVIRF